ncbi:MAG TPA: type II toxin-antitoxin system VapC family toxin [Candidatus Dormibacteraeota bacterium]|nr:type II toxin-antitoxin system VapC family toxin [Candidatus Dormibacteraeota bacterium]
MVDASVLIATIDVQDVHHELAIAELEATRRQHALSLPAVAFSEALVLPYRMGPRPGRSIEGGLRRLGTVEPVTHEVASRAARLRAERQIKLPDALILATAVELRADEILTFDRRWRSLDSRVRVLGL